MTDPVDRAIAAANGVDAIEMTTVKYMIGSSKRTFPVSLTIPADITEEGAFALVESVVRIQRQLAQRQ